jgi:hypothetical protein
VLMILKTLAVVGRLHDCAVVRHRSGQGASSRCESVFRAAEAGLAFDVPDSQPELRNAG